MFERVHHLGMAVADLEAAVALYTAQYGVAEWERIALPERHMVVAVAEVGGTLIELIAPTSDAAAFAKFLAERGPGLHHIAYQVPDLHAALAELKALGVRLIDETPRLGMHNTLVAFVHPKATMGTLVELVQDDQ